MEKMKYHLILGVFLMSIFMGGCGQADDGLPDIKSILNRANVTEMHRGLLEIFPEGTPREYVEEVLIRRGGATYRSKLEGMYSFPDEDNVHGYHYQKPFYLRFLHDGSYTITIFYDQANRVKKEVITIDGQKRNSISISGPTGL